MRKKAILLAVLSLLSMAIFGLQVGFVSAASVTALEPQSKVYSDSAIPVAFSCTPSFSAETSPATFYYVLDVGPRVFFSPALSEGNIYRTTISELTQGNHTLRIHIITYYTDNYFGLTHTLESYSRLALFSVDLAKPSPSPSPTATPTPITTPSPTPEPSPTQESAPNPSPTMEPTPEPTLTPSPTPQPNQTQDLTLPIILAVVVVVAVATIGAIIYSRKGKV